MPPPAPSAYAVVNASNPDPCCAKCPRWHVTIGAWLYGQTQLRIHVLICNGFLRSLARLDLPPSRVGALAGEIEAAADDRR